MPTEIVTICQWLRKDPQIRDKMIDRVTAPSSGGKLWVKRGRSHDVHLLSKKCVPLSFLLCNAMSVYGWGVLSYKARGLGLSCVWWSTTASHAPCVFLLTPLSSSWLPSFEPSLLKTWSISVELPSFSRQTLVQMSTLLD